MTIRRCVAGCLTTTAMALALPVMAMAQDADPIRVAQITTISGGFPFGDTVPGTQSYFNMVNAAGGINGHQIEFRSGDDKGQAGEAAQLARKFVLQDGVVAFIGNTSLADCDTNRAFYEAQGIAVIGGGTQSTCFTQPNWMPVNTGPYLGHLANWDYLFNVIKPESVCIIEQNDAISQVTYEKLLAWYRERHPDIKIVMETYTNDASQNPTPAVTAAQQAGCDAVTLSTVAPNAVAFAKAAKSVGLDATFMSLGSVYDASVPEALGPLAEPGGLGPKSKGFFVGAELAEIGSPAPQVQEMLAQFEKDGVPANFWSQIGWVSAMVFVEALRQNPDADVSSSQGVLAALRAMQPFETGFAASPLVFGDGDRHAPNKGVQMLMIKDGKWVVAPGQNSGDYTAVPEMPDFL